MSARMAYVGERTSDLDISRPLDDLVVVNNVIFNFSLMKISVTTISFQCLLVWPMVEKEQVTLTLVDP